MKITSWATYRKKYVKERWCVKDGVKGWVMDSVLPTLAHYGWERCYQDANYNMFCDEKSKAMAIRIIKANKMDTQNFEYLYYPYYYTGNNNFMDAFYLFRRKLEGSKK